MQRVRRLYPTPEHKPQSESQNEITGCQDRLPILILSGQDLYRERRLHRWIRTLLHWGFAPTVITAGIPRTNQGEPQLPAWLAHQLLHEPNAIHWIPITQNRQSAGACQFLRQTIEVAVRLLNLNLFHRTRIPIFVADPGMLPFLAIARNFLPIIAVDFPDWVSGMASPRTRTLWWWLESRLRQIPLRITVSEPLRRLLMRRWHAPTKHNTSKRTGLDLVVPNMPMHGEFPVAEWFLSVRQRLWRKSTRGQASLVYFSGFGEGARGMELLIQALHRLQTPVKLYIGGRKTPAVMKWLARIPPRHSARHVGWLTPTHLPHFLRMGVIGLTLLDNLPNHWVSLSGKFFDYVHGCLPQIVIGYPAYRSYMKQFRIGLAIARNPDRLAEAIRTLLSSWSLYEALLAETVRARHQWIWENHVTPVADLFRQITRKAL